MSKLLDVYLVIVLIRLVLILAGMAGIMRGLDWLGDYLQKRKRGEHVAEAEKK